MFYVVCTVFSSVLLCRMANIIDYLSDGLYEGEDMDTEAPDDGVVDIPSSETEGGNLGDVDEKDSSILNSSSDSPLRQNVPSVGPGDGIRPRLLLWISPVRRPLPVLAVRTLVLDGSQLQGCATLRRRQ